MDAKRFETNLVRWRKRPGRMALGLACLVIVSLLPANMAVAARGGAQANSGNSANAGSSANTRTATVAPASAAAPAAANSATTTTATQATTSTATPAKPDAALSIDTVTARIKDLEAASDADQPDRATLLDLYRQALSDLKQAEEQKARVTELEKERIAAPYQLEICKREAAAKSAVQTGTATQTGPAAQTGAAAQIGTPAKPAAQAGAAAKNNTPTTAVATLPAGAPLDQWEQLLSGAEQELEAAQKTEDEKDKESQQRAARRLEIPQTIAADRIKLDELQQSSADGGNDDDSAAVIKARHVAARARRAALEAEIALAEKQLQTYDSVSAELLSLEREAAAKTVDELEQRVAAWREAINGRREAEANQEATEAHWAAATAVPAVRQLADENSTLADDRQQLTKSIEQLSGQRQAVTERLDKVSDQFKQAGDKLSATGLTESMGQMLLKERSELAQVEADRRAVRQRQEEISRIQLDLFQFQEELDELHNLDARAQALVSGLPKESQVRPDDVHKLLETKRKYLQTLVEDDNSYFAGLVEVDSKERELLTKADNFRDFIDQRVLWIRSTHPLAPVDAGKSIGAAAWLVQPANWWSAVLELIDGIRNNVLLSLLAASAFAPWIFYQHRLRVAIVKWSRPTPAENTAHGHPALRRACQAAAATFLIATVWPAVAWFAGWLLVGGIAAHGEFPEALGMALQTCAAVLLPLLLVRQICRHDGLAESHFGWPQPLLLELRKQLTWFALSGTPALLVVTLLQAQSNDVWKDSLGRAAFIAGQLCVARFLYSALRPPQGTLHRLLALRSGVWSNRFSMPAFVALLAAPISLAVLASAGYYYTALRLACRLQATVWLILGLVTVHALASIWLRGLYRRMALKAAARSLHSAPSAGRYYAAAVTGRSELPATRQEPAAAAAATPAIDEEKIDLQTGRLLRNLSTLALAIGLCLVWFDMFPALQFFSQVTLWPDVGSDPARPVAITLANLLEAVVVAVLTIVAAGNLPSLLEITVLERLAPDHGVRYALTAVTRYAIVVVGLVVASSAIGIGWGKLQWLIAAMSFGLGFGLQEIFANFVSGLIVLLERPIRIGDTVTVGDVTGVVSRIRMRATTVVDADRKELILPNKDLISGRLVNWTLTDSVVRLVVRLGVAYGSDTEQTQRLLLDVASHTPEVLKSPPPRAVFMGFGEKSLDFELRVFVGHVEALLPVRHQLNMAIDHSFHAAGVELAFAQADTFVRHAEEAYRQPTEQTKAA